ncbi:MAG: trehalose 6-phosphate synthase [Spirochaetaceae bacterium]|nr:MAG: trehalose 6-phosphate synthase [Spirochaetaceae bacterium]
MSSLEKLYALMRSVADARRRLVHGCFEDLAGSDDLDLLRRTEREIDGWPRRNGRFVLDAGNGRQIETSLSYEVEELRRDIVFFEEGPAAFARRLSQQRPDVEPEVQRLVDRLCEFFPPSGGIGAGAPLRAFITDRDGTINNYCGRYRSSVQPAYNALFLCRFALTAAARSVILSSAPLDDGGLIDVSVNLENTFVYAGSKGREYCSESGVRGRYAIEPERQELLDRFNSRLKQILESDGNHIFTLIGSALQFKFGQTTVARQDVDNTVSEQKSQRFLDSVRRLVEELDPRQRFLRIEDTGKDIEIILTVGEDEDAGDFDKGNGIDYLDRELGLELEKGGALICGDTASDVPMARLAVERSAENAVLFVGAGEELISQVRAVAPAAIFVPAPDVLVMGLDRYTRTVDSKTARRERNDV